MTASIIAMPIQQDIIIQGRDDLYYKFISDEDFSEVVLKIYDKDNFVFKEFVANTSFFNTRKFYWSVPFELIEYVHHGSRFKIQVNNKTKQAGRIIWSGR